MNRNEVMTKFFQENYNNLCKKVARRAGTPEATEDVVQDAFYRALRSYDGPDGPPRDLNAWFGIILENSLKDFKQSERRLGTDLYLADVIIEGEEMPEDQDNALQHIARLAKGKKGQSHAIVDLYVNQGYSPKEIASILDIKNQAVRDALQKFKVQVKSKLAE